ncbi:hypothetical protein MRX96_035371 [Rhipicephalus microplus]
MRTRSKKNKKKRSRGSEHYIIRPRENAGSDASQDEQGYRARHCRAATIYESLLRLRRLCLQRQPIPGDAAVSWREPSRAPQTHAPTVPLRHGTHFLAFLGRMPDGRGRVSHWRAGGAVVVALPSPMDDEEEQEAVAGPHLPRAFGAIAVFARVVIYAPSLDGGGCSGGGTVSGRLDAVPADVLLLFLCRAV